jgi:hypothetical protein
VSGLAWVLAVLAAVLAGCGGDDDSHTAGTSTTEPLSTTTTAPPTPEEGFLEAIDERLTFGGSGGPQQALATGAAVCEALDTANGLYTDDAPNDSPETDAAIVEVARTMALAGVVGELDADVTIIVLELTGEHLCPEHAATITDWLRANGYGGMR